MLSNFRTCTFSFNNEPVEYRWLITWVSRLDPGLANIQIDILEFEDIYDEKPNSEGKLLITLKCTPLAFAKAVYLAAREVLERHGDHGYHERWRSKFPQSEFALLKDKIFDWKTLIDACPLKRIIGLPIQGYRKRFFS
jgi:hypothetical protein